MSVLRSQSHHSICTMSASFSVTPSGTLWDTVNGTTVSAGPTIHDTHREAK